MQKVLLKVLRPIYYDTFRCVGPACTDHCCKDWRVEIDKRSYERYRTSSIPLFSKDFDGKIRLTEEGARTDSNYAEMVLDENRVCPFYDTDGLCKMQKECGSVMLCRTCNSYPRKANAGMGEYTGAVELTLNMSCPEAQRRALWNKSPMEFRFDEMLLDDGDPILNMLLYRAKVKDAVKGYVFDIRGCCMDILRERALTVAERLFAVGMLLQSITEFFDTGAYEKTTEILRIYRDSVAAGTFSGVLLNFAKNDLLSAMMQQMLIELIRQIGDGSFHGAAVYRELANVILGWGVKDDGETDYVKIITHADGLAKRYWRRFCDEKGYIVENYFVNLIFATVFPFQHGEELSPYGHFVILAQQYAIMRLLFLAAAEEYGEVSDAMVQSVITALNVATQHSNSAREVAKAYMENEVGSIAHISFLLRG